MQNDNQQLAKYCTTHLELSGSDVIAEYGYSSLPLCVIDAVFSINANYKSTQNTVQRFIDYFDLQADLSIYDFIGFYDQNSIEFMAKNVYRNSQRTSTVNGILKADAVLRVAKLLFSYQVNFLPDVNRIFKDTQFEQEFRQIPGQKSGISLSYFYMLTGSNTEIKPDRMVIRFIESALNRSVRIEECSQLLTEVCILLNSDYPDLTPRSLDNAIWRFQKSQ
jgi:hypothetical protein